MDPGLCLSVACCQTLVDTTRGAGHVGRRHRLGTIGAAAIAAVLVGCGSEAAGPPERSTPSATSAASSATSAPVAGCDVTPEAGVSNVEIDAAGRSYPSEVFRPAGNGAKRLAAVIDLHGLDSDGPTQAAMTGFRRLADREGFVVAEPSGPIGPLGVTGWEIAATDEPDRDDLQAMEGLIQHLVDEACVDSGRVFVAGYSNGGFLAAELGCSTRVKVAGVAAVAGFHAPRPCERHVPTLVLHGTEDPIVPLGPDGTSLIVDATTPAAVTELLTSSIEDEVASSASGAGCARAPMPHRLTATSRTARYSGCRDGADHELILLDGGGHTWPGAAETDDAGFLGSTATDLDATETIWTFFADHGAEP